MGRARCNAGVLKVQDMNVGGQLHSVQAVECVRVLEVIGKLTGC